MKLLFVRAEIGGYRVKINLILFSFDCRCLAEKVIDLLVITIIRAILMRQEKPATTQTGKKRLSHAGGTQGSENGIESVPASLQNQGCST
jgi:hypothetical protein